MLSTNTHLLKLWWMFSGVKGSANSKSCPSALPDRSEERHELEPARSQSMRPIQLGLGNTCPLRRLLDDLRVHDAPDSLEVFSSYL